MNQTPNPGITAAIEELEAEITRGEQQLNERKECVNVLRRVLAQPARYSLLAQPQASAPAEEPANDAKPARTPIRRAKAEAGRRAGRAPKTPRPENGESKLKLSARVRAAVDNFSGIFTARDVAANTGLKLAAVQYQLKQMQAAKTVRLVTAGKPSHPAVYGALASGDVKPTKVQRKAEDGGRKTESPASPPVRSPLSALRSPSAESGPLDRQPGEEDPALVRRAVARLGEPFTRAELDELLPDEFPGPALGLAITSLRSAGVIAFAGQASGAGPAFAHGRWHLPHRLTL